MLKVNCGVWFPCQWQQSYPCCYCSFRLEQDRVNVSAVSYLSKDPLTYQVAESREGRSKSDNR